MQKWPLHCKNKTSVWLWCSLFQILCFGVRFVDLFIHALRNVWGKILTARIFHMCPYFVHTKFWVFWHLIRKCVVLCGSQVALLKDCGNNYLYFFSRHLFSPANKRNVPGTSEQVQRQMEQRREETRVRWRELSWHTCWITASYLFEWAWSVFACVLYYKLERCGLGQPHRTSSLYYLPPLRSIHSAGEEDMGKTGGRGDFEWVYDDQPHTARRKEILGEWDTTRSRTREQFFWFIKKKKGNKCSDPVKPVY